MLDKYAEIACVNCGGIVENKLGCSHCTTRYCSRECQRVHWNHEHRDECSSLAARIGASVKAKPHHRVRQWHTLLEEHPTNFAFGSQMCREKALVPTDFLPKNIPKVMQLNTGYVGDLVTLQEVASTNKFLVQLKKRCRRLAQDPMLFERHWIELLRMVAQTSYHYLFYEKDRSDYSECAAQIMQMADLQNRVKRNYGMPESTEKERTEETLQYTAEILDKIIETNDISIAKIPTSIKEDMPIRQVPTSFNANVYEPSIYIYNDPRIGEDVIETVGESDDLVREVRRSDYERLVKDNVNHVNMRFLDQFDGKNDAARYKFTDPLPRPFTTIDTESIRPAQAERLLSELLRRSVKDIDEILEKYPDDKRKAFAAAMSIAASWDDDESDESEEEFSFDPGSGWPGDPDIDFLPEEEEQSMVRRLWTKIKSFSKTSLAVAGAVGIGAITVASYFAGPTTVTPALALSLPETNVLAQSLGQTVAVEFNEMQRQARFAANKQLLEEKFNITSQDLASYTANITYAALGPQGMAMIEKRVKQEHMVQQIVASQAIEQHNQQLLVHEEIRTAENAVDALTKYVSSSGYTNQWDILNAVANGIFEDSSDSPSLNIRRAAAFTELAMRDVNAALLAEVNALGMIKGDVSKDLVDNMQTTLVRLMQKFERGLSPEEAIDVTLETAGIVSGRARTIQELDIVDIVRKGLSADMGQGNFLRPTPEQQDFLDRVNNITTILDRKPTESQLYFALDKLGLMEGESPISRAFFFHIASMSTGAYVPDMILRFTGYGFRDLDASILLGFGNYLINYAFLLVFLSPLYSFAKFLAGPLEEPAKEILRWAESTADLDLDITGNNSVWSRFEFLLEAYGSKTLFYTSTFVRAYTIGINAKLRGALLGRSLPTLMLLNLGDFALRALMLQEALSTYSQALDPMRSAVGETATNIFLTISTLGTLAFSTYLVNSVPGVKTLTNKFGDGVKWVTNHAAEQPWKVALAGTSFALLMALLHGNGFVDPQIEALDQARELLHSDWHQFNVQTKAVLETILENAGYPIEGAEFSDSFNRWAAQNLQELTLKFDLPPTIATALSQYTDFRNMSSNELTRFFRAIADIGGTDEYIRLLKDAFSEEQM